MLDSTTLLSTARSHLPAVTAFLADLVKISSVNGRDPELGVARRIIQEAKALRLDARLVSLEPERPNVLVNWGEGPAGFALIGHMDTVSEGDPGSWRYPPFQPTIQAGRLYGRGAADNKAGIACGLYSLVLLRDLDLLTPTSQRALLAGVVDEESGASSVLGMRYLLDQDHLSVQAAIYTYASDIICIGHRGLLRLVITACGQPVHSGSAGWSLGQGGVNAVTGLAEILLRLEQLELPHRPHPAFKDMQNKITPGTLIKGGEFESMVPARAEALVDVRLMPGHPVEEVLKAIERVTQEVMSRRPGLQVSLHVKNSLPGAVIPADHSVVRLAEQYTHVFTGQAWMVAGAGPANEGYMLIERGIPTLCGFGPSGGNAHAPDEWVSLESLPATIAMYCGIIADTLNPKQ